ncbi:hypothetical protein SUGI_1168690 [Cryptomeria japonica]|nr:hypothetical protein SUGI_1168690 [Cryptomeria japonica]
MEEGGLKCNCCSFLSSGVMREQRNSLHLQMSWRKGEGEEVPKGCLAVTVGEGEEQERFVIPVVHVNHPLFEKLLKEAEEEYGFQHKGIISIPCHASDFQYVQEIIHREMHGLQGHGSGNCFR